MSQVIFESSKENEPALREIMQKKADGARDVPGLLGSECLWKTSGEAAGFALITRWQSKDAFTAWLAAQHKGQPHKHGAKDETPRPAITKTAYQFETLEP